MFLQLVVKMFTSRMRFPRSRRWAFIFAAGSIILFESFETFHNRRKPMAIYKCQKCGMSIGSMTCGECGKELEHDTLKLDSGAEVTIAKCPAAHGKVKSPQCCGEDKSCSI